MIDSVVDLVEEHVDLGGSQISDVVHSSQSRQDPCDFVPRINRQEEYRLSLARILTSNFDPELMIE